MTTPIKQFPRREATKRVQRAMVTPILCSARLNVTEQLGSFLDVSMMADRCVAWGHVTTDSIYAF